MRPVVVGTAGHIDHGKTALVRRLTGIDTDRLPEERDRGISIDLGFAHLALPSGRRIAIVDVPGHERFVKNMLAGATGIDLVLLVVAADEGVMPQTREHLAIVDLLGVRHGVVALTKSDLASPETARLAREDALDLLRGTSLEGAPLVDVSSVTGAGIPELLDALDRAVALTESRRAEGPTRLPIDRVFSVEGIGTVVTGTLWSGTVRAGDALALLPPGRALRVRQVEVHDEPVERAVAGNRTAVAVHGAPREEIARGDWLVAPDRFRATTMLDVRLRYLADAGKPLQDRARVRVHLGASETLARVVLLEGGPLAPGGAAWAQLRLEGPVVAIPGDKLVLRSYSPSATVAGATVVDVLPTRRPRLEPGGAERLAALQSGSLDRRLALLALEAGLSGLGPETAALRLGVAPGEVEAALAGSTEMVRLPGGAFLDRRAWLEAGERIAGEVTRYGETYRLRSGIPKGELKASLQAELGGALFDAALEDLVRSGRVAVQEDRIGIHQAGPELTPEQSKALEALEGKLLAGGFQPPDLDEALKPLSAAVRPAELARYLVESGRLVKVTSTIAYPAATWSEVEARVRLHFTKKTELTMADFKELLQVSRKYSVPVLEYLDRVGLTRRDGDVRRPGPRLTR